MVTDTKFVESLRQTVQGSVILNPNAHTVTTRNVQAMIALYAYYSDDRSFTSTDGAGSISKLVQISTDTVARLATELHCLRRGGKKTQYFVSRTFGQTLINIVRNAKFTALRSVVDDIQDQIDALGSI